MLSLLSYSISSCTKPGAILYRTLSLKPYVETVVLLELCKLGT